MLSKTRPHDLNNFSFSVMYMFNWFFLVSKNPGLWLDSFFSSVKFFIENSKHIKKMITIFFLKLFLCSDAKYKKKRMINWIIDRTHLILNFCARANNIYLIFLKGIYNSSFIKDSSSLNIHGYKINVINNIRDYELWIRLKILIFFNFLYL